MRGVFSDGVDRLGGQAQTILEPGAIIACSFKIVPTLLWLIEVTDRADGIAEIIDGPGADTSQVGLAFSEGHFDGVEGGGKLCVDIGIERRTIHRALDNPRGDEPIVAQTRHEGLGLPFAKRRLGPQPLSAQAAPA
jgi:hypothetical protein